MSLNSRRKRFKKSRQSAITPATAATTHQKRRHQLGIPDIPTAAAKFAPTIAAANHKPRRHQVRQ